MNELLPCPFCGGEAKVFHYSSAIRDEVWRVVCDKPFCAQGPDGYTEAEAIAAWNTRAERTCECIAEYAKSPIDGKTIVLHRCSACHELMRPHMAYCPNCGARVIRSDQDL